jgi:iron complex transport system substrate-binding protein
VRARLRIQSLAVTGLLITGLSACAPASFSTTPTLPPVAGERLALKDIEFLADPLKYEGPSTALLSRAEIVAPATAPPQTLPSTVTSDELGEPVSVEIPSTGRVLALDMSGSLAATVWALGFGETLVGRDISTTFPGVEDLPVVTGSGHAISPESVLALRPDLIITDGTIGPLDVVLQLRDAGVSVVFVREPAGLSAPAAMARSVAAIFGAPDAGEQLANTLGVEIDAITETIAGKAPVLRENKLRMVFLYLRGANGIYYLFGEESGAGELIEALGGVDIATETGWVGMRPMTDEGLVAANPDLILVMTDGLVSVGGAEELVKEKPAIGLTRAGQKLRFVDMADSQVLSFGPRTPDVIDALARAIYAPEQ